MAIKTEKIDIKSALEQNAELIGRSIVDCLADFKHIPARLKEAIKYTLTAGGKRIRTAVLFWSAQAVCGQVNNDAKIAAVAVEMIHTYSLIHDDLPAMDDDDFRRGRPSCHKAFDEATAILAGDSLLTMAFEILATKISDPAKSAKMIEALAKAAGPEGMIAGQMNDILAENKNGSELQLLDIHINKTAKMFSGAAVLGAIAAGGNDEQQKALENFGIQLGLGFQIADDILDVSSTTGQLGKTVGKDAEQGKLTYPAVYGMEKSRLKAEQTAELAIEYLKPFETKANMLIELVEVLLNRTK